MRDNKPHRFKNKRRDGRDFPTPGRHERAPDRKPREKRPRPERLKANLWGVHAVGAAWLNPARRIVNLYITEQALKNFLPVYERAKSEGLSRPLPLVVDKEQLDRSFGGEAVHQGLAIDAHPLEEVFLQDIINAESLKEKSVLVILDQVTDPHNAGAILRSASAFGAGGVIMQTRHAPEVNNATLAKTACGAVEYVPVAYETNLGRALRELQEAGYRAVGLDERGSAEIGALPFAEKTVLVLGAEGKGLRQSLREQCSVLARLPTGGPILSLNVSNAAAVALYALRTQNS